MVGAASETVVRNVRVVRNPTMWPSGFGFQRYNPKSELLKLKGQYLSRSLFCLLNYKLDACAYELISQNLSLFLFKPAIFFQTLKEASTLLLLLPRPLLLLQWSDPPIPLRSFSASLPRWAPQTVGTVNTGTPAPCCPSSASPAVSFLLHTHRVKSGSVCTWTTCRYVCYKITPQSENASVFLQQKGTKRIVQVSCFNVAPKLWRGSVRRRPPAAEF